MSTNTPNPPSTHKPADQAPQSWTIPPVLSRIVSIPLQALSMYFITVVLQYLVLSVGSANEAFYSRRSPSKLEPREWGKIVIGTVLVVAWVLVLVKLGIVSWKGLRVRETEEVAGGAEKRTEEKEGPVG